MSFNETNSINNIKNKTITNDIENIDNLENDHLNESINNKKKDINDNFQEKEYPSDINIEKIKEPDIKNLIKSTEFRLPSNFIDLSYDNNKDMKNIIQKHFISIKKGKRNKGFKKMNEKKSFEEYNNLLNFIELDKKHKLRLEKYNDNCRYKTVLPYKDNLVKLSNHNFINASWIHIPYPYYFIATQGPLPHTIEDFWTMCYENKVSLIVMLCNLIEKEKEKCANYWKTINLNNFEILKLNDKRDKKEKDIIIRTFEVFNKEKKGKLIITQIHLTSWEDHCVLDVNDFNKIIKIINLIDEYKGKRNAVVHCSAGIGRTGTFICMYNIYHEILQQIYENSDDIIICIMNMVRKIKEMRMHSVENPQQYSSLFAFADYLLKNYNVKK